MSAGNLLINGALLANLWTRFEGGEVPCPPDCKTFAADRWGVRSEQPRGSAVSQMRSAHAPPDGETSLEIRGASGVMADVFLGQTIEAEEALAYRRELRATVWFWAAHDARRDCPVQLVVSQPKTRNVFDGRVETIFESEARAVPMNTWTPVDFTFDARSAGREGLSIEWRLPAAFLAHPSARVRLAAAALSEGAPMILRSNATETTLARRFCQRHDAKNVNAIGRALVCNPHELHFQFTFPEMRVAPALTLPQSNEELGVFSLDGIPQAGFVYDVPHAARGSAIIRATKWNHELADGYLAFRGYGGAIVLEAEL